MKAFEYEASAADGSVVNGRSHAGDENELDRDLESRGLTLLRARAVGARVDGRGLRLQPQELIQLTTQLATVIGAGVRVVEGLRSIGERMQTPAARGVCEDLVARLQGGASLSDAMDRHAASFPPVYRASVRAGEQSGALELVLGRLARYLEWSRNTRAMATQALVYPTILLFALSGLVTVLLYFVLPKIIGLYPGGREALPVQTRALIATSEFLRGNAPWIGVLAIASFAAIAWARREKRWRERIDGAQLRVPYLGTIAWQIATSRFASTASILQDAGCDVFSTLTVAGETCGNAAVGASFQRAAESVRRGSTITQSLEREPWIDPLLLQMVGVGEKTGELDRCLGKLVAYYDEEIPRAVKRLLAFLEPAMLLGSAVIVAFVLMAALMPIYSLYDKVG